MPKGKQEQYNRLKDNSRESTDEERGSGSSEESEEEEHKTALSRAHETSEWSAFEFDEDEWASNYKVKVGKDTLNAAIASGFRLQNGMAMDPHNCIGFAMHVMLQLITAVVQVTIVVCFNFTTIDLIWQNFEPHRRHMWVAIIDKAIQNQSTVNITDPLETRAAALCIRQNATPAIGYMMLFLWLALMCQHTNHALTTIIMVATFPSTKPKDEDGKKKKKKDDKKKKVDPDHSNDIMGKESDKIDHMNTQWKFFLIVFILLPHAILALVVTYVGIDFLVMAGDPGMLVLRAMALKLVMTFDKVFYKAFCSAQFHAYISKAKYVIQKPKSRNYWHSWLISAIKVVMAVIITIITWSHYQWLLDFRLLCKEYMDNYGRFCLGRTCGIQFKTEFMRILNQWL